MSSAISCKSASLNDMVGDLVDTTNKVNAKGCALGETGCPVVEIVCSSSRKR